MAVQIPRLKEITPKTPESVGRIDVQLPDPTHAIAQQTTAVEHIGGQLADFNQSIENNAIDTEVTKREIELKSRMNKRVNGDGQTSGIIHQKGDPTPLWKQFDEQTKSDYDELSNAENMSPAGQQLLQKRLGNAVDQFEVQKLAVQGSQYAKYDQDVYNADIYLKKNDLMKNASVILPNDSGSMSAFDKTVGDIRHTVLKQGLKNGNVVPDDNGNALYIGEDGKEMRVTVGASTQMELKKELSDGIYKASDVLVKSGNLEAAKAVHDKYGDNIDAVNQEKFATEFKKEDKNAQAYKAAGQAEQLGPQGAEKLFNKLDPEIADQARKIRHERNTLRDEDIKRVSTNSYNQIVNIIADKQNNGQGFAGPIQMENDKTIKLLMGNVTDARQKEAIYAAVSDGPKISSPDAVVKFQNLLVSRDDAHPDGLRGLSPEDLNQYLSGLSKSDRLVAKTKWTSLNTETGAQQNERYKVGAKRLESTLIALNYLQPDPYNGHITGDDQAKLNAATASLTNDLDAHGPGPMSPKELTDFVDKKAAAIKKGEVFQPAPRPTFQGTAKSAPTPAIAPAKVQGQGSVLLAQNTPAPEAAPTTTLPLSDSKQWMQKFVQTFHRAPKFSGELDNFIKSESTKK